MVGNIWEWRASHADDYPQAAHLPRDDFAHGDDGPALRGGNWTSLASQASLHARMAYLPSYQVLDFGFRVCVVGV